LGQNLLILGCGILIYAISAVFLSPMMSFLAAFWYWAFRGAEFFYAYNHSGGVLAILSTIYFLFRYIRQPSRVLVFAGFASLFFLILIRLNMGVALLVGFVFSLCLTDFLKKEPLLKKQVSLYITAALLTLALAGFIYP
jgi:hypothetical protein